MTKSRDFGTCKEEEGETARQTVRLPIAEIFKRQKHFFSLYPIFAFLGSKKRWKRWHKNSANSDAISFPPFFPRLSKRERNGRRRRDRPSKKKQRRNFRRRRRGILTQIFGLEKEEKQKKIFRWQNSCSCRSNSMACFAYVWIVLL